VGFLSGMEIPADLYAWLAVFALPVNSMLNPITYTITTKVFKQNVSKLSLFPIPRFLSIVPTFEDGTIPNSDQKRTD